jgi:sortase A
MTKKLTKRKKLKRVMITLGCCCLIAAATFGVYNKIDSDRASEAAEQLADNISVLIEENKTVAKNIEIDEDIELDSLSNEPMQEISNEETMSVGEYEISGILEVPETDTRLAIISEWSYPFLTVSACRYSGSPDEQMILLAHNYPNHFGKLDQLESGDDVSFTDINGTVYNYKVTNSEIWETGQLREIISGDSWDLTLFTCTYDGRSRVVVRCEKADEVL